MIARIEAQEHTGQQISELAEAQKRTDEHVSQLDIAMAELAQTVKGMSQELGGLSRSVSYSLENEAYHALPAFLKAHHDIEHTERLIRTEIDGEEVNLFAHGVRVSSGQPVIIVGETKLRLDERRSNRRDESAALSQIADKVEAVRTKYGNSEIVPPARHALRTLVIPLKRSFTSYTPLHGNEFPTDS